MNNTGEMIVSFLMTIGIIVLFAFVMGLDADIRKLKDTHCAIEFEYAPTSADSLAVVSEYEYCLERMNDE